MDRPVKRWGLFGGSFDPPHVGHLMAGALALSRGDIDRLVVVPCFDHPFGKAMAPYEERLAMARMAFEPLARAEVSDIESRLERPSRTLFTLRALAAAHPGARWSLVVGADVPLERAQWHRFDDLIAEADLFVIGRAGRGGGASTPDVPDVSSTELRRRLAADEDLCGWLDARVERHIRSKGLYGVRR